jgi:Tfp pilus assembly protein PilF
MFRAIDYCDQGDESRREAELVKAIRLAPQYARAHYDLGHHYGILGQTDKAIDKFQEALSHDLSFAPAYFNLGVAYGHLQQPEESARYYHKTIELDDSFPEAHNNLGFHYASVEEFGRAQTHWYRAVELGYIVNVLAIKKAAGVRSGGCLSVLLTGMLVAAGVVLIVLLN